MAQAGFAVGRKVFFLAFVAVVLIMAEACKVDDGVFRDLVSPEVVSFIQICVGSRRSRRGKQLPSLPN